MRRSVLLSSLSLLILLVGCRLEHDGDPPPPAGARQLWPRGSAPVPSPADSRVLFTQEESPSGLYVLQDNSATILNPSGPESRTDYTWSPNAQRIAFSSPGQPGSAQAGIWISDAGNLTSLHRIWDRGFHPRLYPAPEDLLVCAGPEDGTDDEGIWEMDFSGANRARISPIGVDPEVSPNGGKIAYLVTTGSSTGRTMIVYNRVSYVRDTVAVSVLRHEWLSDSQTLVYETIQNGGQEVNVVGPNDNLIGVTIAGGTSPSAMSDNLGFLFTAINGDRAAGIFRGAVGQSAVPISTFGTNARHAGGNRAVAQDSTTLIEILF